MVRFGPAGQDDIFPTVHKKMTDMPAYLAARGLTAFEYQCGHGVRVSRASAIALGEKAKEHGVAVSLHAPYYISLSSSEEEKRENSLGYILKSAQAVSWMGGERIVVHSGSVGKRTREQALELAVQTLTSAQKLLDEERLSHIRICPETMGKIGQLGDLDEVLTLCGVDERFIPCIDFGHLNSRTQGGVNDYAAMAAVLDKVANTLGTERARVFHAHFSKIEYGPKGETRHLTFDDTQYGPDFEPLGRLLAERRLSPTIICESSGRQIDDAAYMLKVYQKESCNDAD
ncbi:MAG: TIM barrel protein [Oscillospiraceae bacterium]|nr:TIM barrel protein [Oscillospiraceae bacterium]